MPDMDKVQFAYIKTVASKGDTPKFGSPQGTTKYIEILFNEFSRDPAR